MTDDNKKVMHCCGKDWSFEYRQTLNNEDVKEAVCLECGGFERHVIGQLDEEELDEYKVNCMLYDNTDNHKESGSE